MQEGDRDQSDSNGTRAGDIIHGTLGTDFIANPQAWERWSYNEVWDFPGARTSGGMRFDDEDPEIFWAANQNGELGGLYKMKIVRQARSWERVTSFGDNGFAPHF